MVLGARDPATFATCSTRVLIPRARRPGPPTTPTECSRTTVSRGLLPTAFRSISPGAGWPWREVVDVSVHEAELVREERVEGGVRGDHRQTGRGRLVDDLVRRPFAHVVDERVHLGVQAGHGVVRRRAADVDPVEQAELDHEPLERHLVEPLLLRDRRAVHAEADPLDLLDGAYDRLEALRRRRPPQREQGQRLPVGALDAREPRDVDPVADRDELPRAQRERALVDAEDVGREPLRGHQQRLRRQCVNQSMTLTPVGRARGAASTA